MLKKDSITSSLDGALQVFYYYRSNDTRQRPLVVQLHSWSYPVDSFKTSGLESAAITKNYNYIFPNFRGVNNRPQACCSEFVISDIDEAIDWALKNMNVDQKNIYVAGESGGGYATLAMYMKSRHDIRSFSAWVPISDLITWYAQSTERKNKYAREIIQCTGSSETLDTLKAKQRSPLYWSTPVQQRANSSIQLFAGIHDGYIGPVPISQSINFYNKLLADFHETDTSRFVSRSDSKYMIERQSSPHSGNIKKIGDRIICYQKSAKNIMLTIFEGGHEMLSKEVIGYIEQALK
jgi:dipeptidyl aminopeptidase/acylaminoacyl peptidase